MSSEPVSTQSFDVICPIFNEERTIPLFFERIKSVFGKLAPNYKCRLVFVDNASVDRSQEMVRAICENHPWVDLIVMSRNFGYQCSVECGLRNSNSDLTAIVDVDCEDPPELFIDFLKYTDQGYDVVYGERLDRPEPWIIKQFRKLFYRFTRFTADDFFVLDMAEFCVMKRIVRDAIVADNNSFPFIRASIGRVGFALKNVAYTRHRRIAGETHYNFFRMALFAVAGILSSSTLWLRIPTYLFPFWFLGSLALLGVRIYSGNEYYYELLVMIGFLFLGFTVTGISLYLARVYKNGLHRPNYFVNLTKCFLRGKQAR